MGTEIKSSTANMIYYLGPPLEGQKMTIGHPGHLLGELVARWAQQGFDLGPTYSH